MQAKLRRVALAYALAMIVSLAAGSETGSPGRSNYNEPSREIESAVLAAAAAEPQQEESYQKVYEAFSRLMENVSNNSLSNVRRLVARLNRLVGGGSGNEPGAVSAVSQVQSGGIDERTEQILNRLDQVNKNTDQHTLRQLNDDISRLIGSLNDSYLRNVRRVVERVNKVVGRPVVSADQPRGEHLSPDRLDDPNIRQPGFPGMDELIAAMDNVQKSLAHFVRSSTRLITSG